MSKNQQIPTLILFCGLPGSGKTTLARQMETELPAVRLCPDEWLASLGIDLFDEAARNKLEIRLWRLAQELLGFGQNVILENGLWTQVERDAKRHDVASLNIRTELHYFDLPFEELMRRVNRRNHTGGHGTVPLTREQMAGYARLFQAPTSAELALFDQAVVHGGT